MKTQAKVPGDHAEVAAEDDEQHRAHQDAEPSPPLRVFRQDALVASLPAVGRRQRRRGDGDAEQDQEHAERRRQEAGPHMHQSAGR